MDRLSSSLIHCLILTDYSSISASGQYHSIFLLSFSLSRHPSLLSSMALHHHMSLLSPTYLSLQTNAKPVVTDKALLTNCKMMKVCLYICVWGQLDCRIWFSNHPNSTPLSLYPINMAFKLCHAMVDTHTREDHVKTSQLLLLHGN